MAALSNCNVTLRILVSEPILVGRAALAFVLRTPISR